PRSRASPARPSACGWSRDVQPSDGRRDRARAPLELSTPRHRLWIQEGLKQPSVRPLRTTCGGADGEIRTLTDEDLNLVPLPLGYVGDAHKDRDRCRPENDRPSPGRHLLDWHP